MRLVFELRLFAEFQTCYPRRDKRSCFIGVHLTVCTFYISFVNRSFVFKNTCDHPPFLNSRKHFSSEEKREITSYGIQSVFFQRLLRYRQTKIEFQKYPRWEPLLIPPATFIHLKEVLQHSRLGPIHFVMVCFTKEWNLSFQFVTCASTEKLWPKTFIPQRKVLQHYRCDPIDFLMVYCFTQEWKLRF